MQKFKLNRLSCLGFLALSSSLASTSVLAAATEESTVDNGDGTFTYSQKINSASSAPHYTVPASGGLNVFAWFDDDYGWQHSFSDIISDPTVQIQSATVLIRGYDIDSEAFHGTSGEYDGVSIDGVDLNPGLLQGTNETWSETTFDVPLSAIQDDGLINTFLDVDMNHTTNTWRTKIDYSLLTITYQLTTNNPPSQPTLSMTPSSCTSISDDLVVNVTGPTPADLDGDDVTYSYRWFVDIGQGSVVDDEVAGKTDHQGNTVLASETASGETWRVQVTATDDNDLMSDFQVVTWENIGVDCDQDGVLDEYDEYPSDPERAFNNASTQSTLVFEDLWPNKGDYDLNDFVLVNTFNTVTNADGHVKEVTMTGAAVARGASYANAFALSFANTNAVNVVSSSVTIDETTTALVPEAGHTDEVVMVLIDDIFDVLPLGGGIYPYYNSQDSDDRPQVPVSFSIVFETAVDSSLLGSAPFNPFIYRVADRGIEIHLVDNAPSDLADLSLFSTKDDGSEPDSEIYYQTSGGHPWALNITSTWGHPLEYIDVLFAYPQMQTWAESGGVDNPNWYDYPDEVYCW